MVVDDLGAAEDEEEVFGEGEIVEEEVTGRGDAGFSAGGAANRNRFDPEVRGAGDAAQGAAKGGGLWVGAATDAQGDADGGDGL